MKQLITLIAVLLLIMPFPQQTMRQSRINADQSAMQKIVHNAKEQAKQDGYFSAANKDKLVEQLETRFANLDIGEISVEATGIDDRKERGELIYYKIAVPIHNVIAAAKFYGIDPRDNQTTYIIENYTTSEWLP